MQIDYDVGDCVVCITDDYDRAEGDELWWAKKGGIYTVAAFDDCANGLFVELKEDPYKLDPEAGYRAEDFKKLQKASDEFTEQMRKLKPHKQNVDA